MKLSAIVRRKVALVIDGKIAQRSGVRVILWNHWIQIVVRHAAVGAGSEGILAPDVLPFANAPAESKLPPESTTWPWKPGCESCMGVHLDPRRPFCARIRREYPRCRCSSIAHRRLQSPGRSWASDCPSAEFHPPRIVSDTPSPADAARHCPRKASRVGNSPGPAGSGRESKLSRFWIRSEPIWLTEPA